LGGRKGIQPVKNMGGWWRWALVSLDGVVPSQMVGVCLLLIFPCIMKSRNSLLAPAHLDGPRNKGHKTVVVVVVMLGDLQEPEHKLC